jgi:nitrite reductase (NADH) large subunit
MAEIDQLVPEFDRCYCTGVMKDDVVEAVLKRGCRSLDEVRSSTGACSGCRSCRPELEALVQRLVAPPPG